MGEREKHPGGKVNLYHPLLEWSYSAAILHALRDPLCDIDAWSAGLSSLFQTPCFPQKQNSPFKLCMWPACRFLQLGETMTVSSMSSR